MREARKATGLKSYQFAEKAGIDSSQYSKAERGIEGLGSEKIKQIVKAHGINMDFLSTGKGEILHSGNDGGQGVSKDDPLTVKSLARALEDQAAANLKHANNYEKFIDLLKGIDQKLVSNLDTIARGQDAGFGLLAEHVMRDVRREVDYNQEKADEILDEIARKTGPDLWAKMKGRIVP